MPRNEVKQFTHLGTPIGITGSQDDKNFIYHKTGVVTKELRISIQRMNFPRDLDKHDTELPKDKQLKSIYSKSRKKSLTEYSQERHFITCSFCGEKVVSKLFKKHLIKCKKQMTCIDCFKCFSDKSVFHNHCQTCSPNLNCTKCLLKFDDSLQLQRHNETCNIFACEECSKCFISFSTLSIHRSAKHNLKINHEEIDLSTQKIDDRSFVCDRCSESFASDELKKGDRFLCAKCVSFTTNDSIEVIQTGWSEMSISSEKIDNDPLNISDNSSTGDNEYANLESNKDHAFSKSPIDTIITDKCPHCSEAVVKIFDFQSHLKTCSELAAYMKKKAKLLGSLGNNQYSNGSIQVDNCETVSGSKHSGNQSAKTILLKSKQNWLNAFERYKLEIDDLFDKISSDRSIDCKSNQEFICKLCHKIQRSRRSLNHHLDYVHKMKVFFSPPMQYSCNYCHIEKSTLKEMNTHLYYCHVLDFKCHYCSSVLASKAERIAHVVSAHPEEAGYECTMCPFKINNAIQLRQHTLWHSKQEIISCNVCSKKVKGRLKYGYHLKWHKIRSENNMFLCPKCGKRFTSRSGFRQHHLNIHHPKKFILCPICGKLVTERYIANHQKLHGKNRKQDDRPYQCTDCPLSFKRKQSLAMHKNRRHSLHLTVCRFCNIDLVTHQAYKEHRIAFHKKQKMRKSDKGYHCPLCPKILKHVSSAQLHFLKSHEPHRHVKCNVCPRTFPLEWQLRKHMATHDHSEAGSESVIFRGKKSKTTRGTVNQSNDKNFLCSYCPASFKRRNAQIVHEHKHTIQGFSN